MELKIAGDKLLEAISVASSVVSSRPTLPILGNVLIDAGKDELRLIATDLEVGIVVKLDAKAKGEGKLTVPAKKLFEVLREMPKGDLCVEFDSANKMTISAGEECEFKLLGLPPDEFPQLPEVKKEAEVKVSAKVLAKMIKKTIYSVSSDETRYVLNGANVVWEKNELKMVTTDGRRLAFIKQPLESTGGRGEAIIPTKALQELGKLLAEKEGQVQVVLGEGYAKFSCGNLVLTTRLIDGNFPDYEQVIPKSQDKKLKIETEKLLAATKRASLMAADRSSSVRLDLKRGLLTLSAASHELGEAREDLKADYDGESLSVAYNAQFLLDVLKNIETKDVHLELSTALAPGLLCPADDDSYKCVVMPIRL